MTGKQNSMRGRCASVTSGLIAVCWSMSWSFSWAPVPDDPAPGGIRGRVVDTTQGRIPGATVTLNGALLPSPATTVSGETGEFTFVRLPPGNYHVQASFPGFQDSKPTLVQVGAGEGPWAEVELVLPIGGLVSTAQVEAERSDLAGQGKLAPIEQPIETELPILRPELIETSPYLRARLSSDWYGIRSDGSFFSQISNRLRLIYGARPGEGWTWKVDGRHRASLIHSTRNQVILYDANISYDDYRSRFFFSAGQMNLYDNAGIGELLGGMAGYRVTSRLSAGAYGGLQPDFYGSGLDAKYHKFGFFTRYKGPKAETLSVSYNELRYGGKPERRFLYLTGLVPVRDRAFLYGNVEYEMGGLVRSQDRLSRLFFSSRFDLSRRLDLMASFSSGKGLDFHRYLIESAQEPLRNDTELERFYYNTQYGLRLRFKVGDHLRLHLGQRASTRRDSNISNQTTQFGFSASDLAHSGISVYANYNLNRGDRAESDSLYLSISRTFGRVAWTTTYSNVFNGLRFDPVGQSPQIVHLPNRHTVSNELFITLNRNYAISVQHEHSFLGMRGEDLFFIRFLLRM